jgi:MFS transporter, UMF1 family
MDKRAVRGWMMYDWANSAFATTMLAAVLPLFYSDVAASTIPAHLATSYWGYTHSIAMLIVLVLAPILGAVADYSGSRKRMLLGFAGLGIVASAAFVLVGKGDYILASILMVIGTVGYTGANSFYDSLLTVVSDERKRDMVSSQGFAMGYVGGGVLLVINLMMIMKPGWFGLKDTIMGMYASFLSVAVWWAVFSIPLMRHVREPAGQGGLKLKQYASVGFGRTWSTLKRAAKYPELLKFLIAYWFFNDGISTIITMATIYGKEIGIGTTHLITALVITQFVGIPMTLLFGVIGEKLGSKPSLYISLSVYVMIVILGYFMSSSWHFYALAAMVGCVQGGSQSIARSIYSRLVPRARASEFFGFLSVSGKFSSMFGPFVFGLVGQLTGSSRMGILSLVLFFAVGILLLVKVNIDKGHHEAEAAVHG